MTTESKPVRYRRAPITLVLHLYEDVRDDLEDGGRFWVEESHCLDNYIADLAKEHEANPGVCNTCHRGNAYLGHIPMEAIESAQAAMPEISRTATGENE
jgi:hypothetical protein